VSKERPLKPEKKRKSGLKSRFQRPKPSRTFSIFSTWSMWGQLIANEERNNDFNKEKYNQSIFRDNTIINTNIQ